MEEPFDPYHRWLGIPPQHQPPHHYRLLGLEPFESDPQVIEAAADRQMAHVRTFQSGRRGAASQLLLNEIAAARSCLLDSDRKSNYDSELRVRIAAAAIDEATAGLALGEYELLDLLSRSETGQLFKARHRTLGRVVALKILSPEAIRTPEMLERFRRKSRVLGQLSHPNLVAAHDAGERDGVSFLTMELVEGRDLGSVLRHFGPLPIGRAAEIAAQAARGLGHAHEHGVIHRNVKPGNLMIDRRQRVKVVGLGLALIAGDRDTATAEAGPRIVGTLDYIAPEQTYDSDQIDARADIYGLGCTLFTLLTGRKLFSHAATPAEKVRAHRDEPPPHLQEHRTDAPAELAAIVAAMVAKRPDDRPESMEAVAAELGKVR